MITKLAALNLKKLKGYADWQLLLFLVLFLNVKLAVKIPAILLIYSLQFNFRFGFRLKNSKLPLFYILIIGVAIFNLLLFNGLFNIKYDLVFFSGIAFWGLCILALHQIKLAVERNSVETVHQTIFIFFLLNAVVSVISLACIILETKTLNPYLYQGMYQKYFISTGDYIKGITFDVSITNSVLNALGVIYFLFKKNMVMLLFCMAVLLLTGSNALNVIMASMLLLLFIGYSNRDQKSIIIVCLGLLAVFMVKVSPQNSNYALQVARQVFHQDTIVKTGAATNTTPITLLPDSVLRYDERREKTARIYLDSQYKARLHLTGRGDQPGSLPVKKLLIPKPDLNARPYQEASDTSAVQHKLLLFIKEHPADLPLSGAAVNTGSLPGKAVALVQTINFLWRHPQKMLTGNGIGNFSSKIAFKATSFGLTGSYPGRYTYINQAFMSNHLDIYLNYFSKNIGLHSVINNPDAVYCQLLGEYGVTGMIIFVVYYLGYFLKYHRQLTYGIPLLVFLLAIFFLEYWFEQLSVVVFIELLLLLNIKETTISNTAANA